MAHEFLHSVGLSVSTHEMAWSRTAKGNDFASQTLIVNKSAEINSDANSTHRQAQKTDLNVIRQDGPKSAKMPSVWGTANLLTLEEFL